MDLGSLILQNLFSVCSSVVAAVVGYLLLRVMRGVRASTERTELHAEKTEQRLSQLDKVSVTANNAALEEWQRDVALRVEAVAESKSDTLAWQANVDRRLAAVEKFARDLDAFAHGHADTPTYTPPATTPTPTTHFTEDHHELIH
jgi:hypothetical protein